MLHKALGAPDWLAKSSVYQINPRTFSAEGTLKAVTRELPYLKEMGFNIIYLCPIFEADTSENRDNWSDRQKKYETQNPKNPYRMNNYFRIDEEYGTMEDLAECVQACHKLGMRLLLDLVYFHIGPNGDILQTHPEFARQDADGNTINGPWHFPAFDFNCPGLREYLWCNMVYYIAVLDVDGFRCDVADMVPLDFWVEGRRRILAVKPDAILINEGTNGNSMVTAFNAVYGFSWHSKVYDVLVEGHSVTELRDDWSEVQKMYPAGGYILRDMENHDTSTDWPDRIENMLGHSGMDMIQALNYTMDGIPMVYTGNELADQARINMFANRFYPGKYTMTDRSAEAKAAPAAQSRQALMRQLNQLKKEDPRYSCGKTTWLEHDKPDDVIAFSREYEGKRLWFVGNARNKPAVVALSEEVPLDAERTIARGGEQSDGNTFKLEPYGFIVIRE